MRYGVIRLKKIGFMVDKIAKELFSTDGARFSINS